MRIFISYPSEQHSLAYKINELLLSIGLNVFFDKDGIAVGQDWEGVINENLEKVDAVILICSEEINSKRGIIQKEVKKILEIIERLPIGEQFLFPIRVGEAKLHPQLAKYQYTDTARDGWEIELLEGIKHKCDSRGFPSISKNIEAAVSQMVSKVDSDKKNTIYHEDFGGIEIEESYFQYNEVYEVDFIRLINACITKNILDSRFHTCRLSRTMEEFNDAQHYSQLGVEEFFRQGNLVSLRYFSSSWLGGAHPNHGIFTENFAGPSCGSFSLQELLSHSSDDAIDILKYCDKKISEEIAQEDIEADILSLSDFISNDPDKDVWPLIEQFNFDDKGLTFNFSPYDVLPHVYGFQDVFLPWSSFKYELDEEFENTELARLIEHSRG